MKTAFALLLLVTPLVWADRPTTGTTKPTTAKSATKICVNCGFAPCRCGYSPSYYTQYRKPVRRIVTRRASNVVPSTSRASHVLPSGRASNVVPTRRASNVVPSGRASNVVPTGRASHVVPSGRASNVVPTGRASNVVPTRRASNVVPRPSLTPSLGSRSRSGRTVPAVTPNQRLGYVPQPTTSSPTPHPGRRAGISRTTNRPLRSTTLVPSPRRPKATPSATPRQKLGYDPSRSWSNRRRR